MPINAAHGNIREPSGEGWDRLESRLTGPEYGPADGENEFSLRPRNFDEYIGQDAIKENLSVLSRPRASGATVLTMCCCTARPGWARRRCPASSPRNWA